MVHHNSESGSSHAIVVIALVVALMVALGYIFWQNMTVSDETQSTKETSKPSVAVENKDEVYKGERVTSMAGAYSLKVPNGWELINNNDDSSGNDSFDKNYLTTGPGIEGKLLYDESTPPLVTAAELGGWGGFAELFTVSAPMSLPEDASAGNEFKTDDGTIGKKYETKTLARPDAEIYATTDDFYSYRYLFEKNGTVVQVVFDVFAGNRQAYRTIIDDVVRSLRIS